MDKNVSSYFKGLNDGAAHRAAEAPTGGKSVTNISRI